jgi:hypothetical protein
VLVATKTFIDPGDGQQIRSGITRVSEDAEVARRFPERFQRAPAGYGSSRNRVAIGAAPKRQLKWKAVGAGRQWFIEEQDGGSFPRYTWFDSKEDAEAAFRGISRSAGRLPSESKPSWYLAPPPRRGFSNDKEQGIAATQAGTG